MTGVMPRSLLAVQRGEVAATVRNSFEANDVIVHAEKSDIAPNHGKASLFTYLRPKLV